MNKVPLTIFHGVLMIVTRLRLDRVWIVADWYDVERTHASLRGKPASAVASGATPGRGKLYDAGWVPPARGTLRLAKAA